jgi:uncharacterized protein with HEPN domain
VSRDWRLRLDDMLESCRKLTAFESDIDREGFLSDAKTRSAVERELFVLGEAAKNIPSDVRDRFPDLPWRGMAGLRDVLAHGYFDVEPDVLWDAATTKVPGVLRGVREILEQERSP